MGIIINNRKKSKSKKKTSTTCFPGANISFLTNRIEELKTNKNLVDIALHVGGNDVRKSGERSFRPTEEIIENYKNLIEAAKMKSRRLVIIGIIPRQHESIEWHSRAIAINTRVEALCKNLHIDFIDLWTEFNENAALFDNKGIHLSRKGSNHLADNIIKYLNKVQGN
jgi:lysophospholipase L1-like esterase